MSSYSSTELIDIAKQVERAGEAFYEEAQKHMKEGGARDLFRYLHAEERRHAELFEKLLGELELASGDWRVDEDYVSYMRAIASSHVFPDPEAARNVVKTIRDEEAAVLQALGFEKDTILFLHELRPSIAEESRSIIDKLVDEERKHVRALSDMLDGLKKRRLSQEAREP